MQAAKDERGVLKLSGSLLIDSADELRSVLLEFISAAGHPVVDLSEVCECDFVSLQLLLSARRTADYAAKRLELRAVPPAVVDAGAAVGLCLDESAAGSEPRLR